MNIAVVTDSTADLPKDVADAHNVRVVPLNVLFGTDEYKDGVTIDNDEFYRRLQSSPELPTTSQPSPGEFAAVYRELAESSDAIISIHVSQALSGTYASALQAKAELEAESCRIEVVDSRQASVSLGLTVTAVARIVAGGADIDTATAAAKDISGRARFYAMLDTLEYLQKGGRVGRAQAFIGGLLKVVPIITVEDGEVQPVERPRTRRRGLERLKALTRARTPFESLAVLHTTEPEVAAELASDLADVAPDGEVMTAQIGSVVGTYAGPGTLGVGFVTAAAP
jgi:DegV family protein with EDD domain